MNFSLKPHPLVAHWVPGFTFLTLIWLSRHDWNFDALVLTGPQAALITLILSVAAFVIGQVFDAFRDTLIETFLNKGDGKEKEWEKMWEKIINADTTKADRFEEYYFTWYVLDWNLALSLIAFLLISLCAPACICSRPCLCLVVLIIVALFIANALSLRKEMIKLVKGWA